MNIRLTLHMVTFFALLGGLAFAQEMPPGGPMGPIGFMNEGMPPPEMRGGMMPGMPGMPGTLGPAVDEGVVDTEATNGFRDPFWPMDWDPSLEIKPPIAGAGTNVAGVVEEKMEWPELKMKGSVKSPEGKYLARIEGVGWVTDGDTIMMKRDGFLFKWKINKVTDEAISARKLEVKPLDQK